MESETIREKFSEFLNEFYKDELLKVGSEQKKSLNIDFSLLDRFDIELADYLLENPMEVIEIAEDTVKQFDIGYSTPDVRLRFYNFPESREIRIRNIRAEHLGKLIVVDGIVKRASEIRPEVSEAIFECMECGAKLTIIQTERIIKAPIVCDSCDNRKGFKLVSQRLYDARWVVIEEPFEIVSGERPSDIRVYLKEDLTVPKMQNKTDPGNRIKIAGVLKEMAKRMKGTQSRQMEIYIDANYVENIEAEWEELEITSEDEQRLVELANDPEIYNKLVLSIAPAIYGHDEVKEAIALQLFGGEIHIQRDKSRVRGDIHTLLVGDPSTSKSAMMKVVSTLIPRGRYVSGKGVSIDFDDPVIFRENGEVKTELIGRIIDQFYSKSQTGFASARNIEVPCLNPSTLKMEWRPVRKVYRHSIDEDIFKIVLRTGREVRVTGDHSIFAIEGGKITAKKANELKIGDILLVPNKIPIDDELVTEIAVLEELKKSCPNEIKQVYETGAFIKTKFSEHKIPKTLKVNEELMRLLGYYIADGSIDYDGKNQFKLKFDIDRKDEETIEDIKNISKQLFGIEAKVYERKDSKCNSIYIHDKLVCLIFKDIIKVGRDAHTKRIPSLVFNVNIQLQKSFLYALVKGDYGVTVSKLLISDILYLLLVNGIVGSFITRKINRVVVFPDGHSSKIEGEVYELKSPKIRKILKSQISNSNLHSRVPIEFFKSKLITMLEANEYIRVSDSGYRRINSKFKQLIYERLKLIGDGVSSSRLSVMIKRRKKSTEQYLQALVKKGFVERINRVYKITTKGKKLLEEIDFLNKLRNSDLAFLKIKEIEKIKSSSKFVYDFSVDGYENFVGGFGGVLCHNTGAGLTATVVKDEEFLGGWVLEAGALVMCNKSLCAIDEFEKIDKSDQVALHEMMEQQTISIAKANILATLPAQTAILAGANPKFGRFDPYLPIKEQVDIPETILTRYDLKFALRDIPNPELDAKITEHILKARHFGMDEVKPAIDSDFLRKYVAYARKNVHPILTKEAGDELTKFYLSLRERSGEGSPISITPRQYEALIRMAEASAKIQLRKEVNVEDAIRSMNLMKASLRQFGFEPETGMIDIDRAEGARATSAQRNKIRVLLDVFDELMPVYGKEIPASEIIRKAKENKMDNPDDILRKLQQEGVIFSPKPEFYSKV